MAYDPKQPTSRHNEYPLRLYPIKKGTKVLYLSNTSREIMEGKIDWYSHKPSHNADEPFYNIIQRGTAGHLDHISPAYIRLNTKHGRADLLFMLADIGQQSIKSHIETIKDLSDYVEARITEARKLLVLKSAKPRRKSLRY